MVADAVGHRAQQEALGARHALVAHHDQVGVVLLGNVENRVGGIALTLEGLRGDAGLLDVGAALAPDAAPAAKR